MHQTDGLMNQSFTLTRILTSAFYEALVVTKCVGKNWEGGRGARATTAPPLATALFIVPDQFICFDFTNSKFRVCKLEAEKLITK